MWTTGGMVPLSAVERIAAALRDRALLIVDEAYTEFAETTSASTLLAADLLARPLSSAEIGQAIRQLLDPSSDLDPQLDWEITLPPDSRVPPAIHLGIA